MPHPTPTFDVGRAARTPARGLTFFIRRSSGRTRTTSNLLRASLKLRDQGLDLSLALTGSGGRNLARSSARCADRLGLSPHVRMLGFVMTEQLMSLYRHAVALTIILLRPRTSRHGGVAARCPVVASDVCHGARTARRHHC